MFRGVVTDIFFDLDHTLWDFNRNSALTFERIFREQRLEIPMDDFLKIYMPLNASFWKLYREEKISKEALRYQRLKQTFDALSINVEDEEIHTLSDAYIQYLSTFGNLIPGTEELLEHLKPNYRLHIITNGFHEIQGKKLRISGIDNYFHHVIDSEMAGCKKPNPRIFELALQKAEVEPHKSVMVGDTLEADILGAKAMGMHAIHFNSNNENHHNHCQIVANLHEIKNYL